MAGFLVRARLLIPLAAALVGAALLLRLAVLDAPTVQASTAELPPAATEPYAPQRVVYHITTTDGWFSHAHRSQLSNIRNHLNSVGDDKAEIVALMNGDGVGLLTSAKSHPEVAAQVDALRGRGVRFLICRNTLVDRHMPLDALYGARPADLVQSGVAELARLEQQGYAYIRP